MVSEKQIPQRTEHRQRMRNKMLVARDFSSFADYELLEFILMAVIPRKDVRGLAKEILGHFNNCLGKLFSADVETLMQVKGVGLAVACALKSTHELLTRSLRAELIKAPVLSKWEFLVDYVSLKITHKNVEFFCVLYLNTRYHLIEEEFNEGTIDYTTIYPREIIKKALNKGASFVVFAHNHPTGDCRPSETDKKVVFALQAALLHSGIQIMDNLIFGKNGVFSFRAKNMLDKLQ